MNLFLMSGLIVMAVIFLIWGIICIIRGLRSASEEKSAIPISDLKEIKKEFSSFSNQDAVQKKVSLDLGDSITSHLIKENLSKNKSSGTSVEEVIAQQNLSEYQDKIKQLKEENRLLSDALQRELSSKSIKTLSKEERDRMAQIEEQYINAQRTINKLTEEKIKLEKSLEDFRKEEDELKAKLNALSEENELVKKFAEEKSREIEDVIRKEKESQDLMAQNLQEMSQVKDEDDKLRTQHEANLLKINNLEEELSKAKELLFNQGSQTNLEIESLKKENGSIQVKLKESLKTIEDLQIKLSQATKDDSQISSELDRATNSLQHIKSERDSLLIEKEEILANYNKLKELNASLFEKEKILQYELTKSRAKALGLERICEDFKLQIEDAAIKK